MSIESRNNIVQPQLTDEDLEVELTLRPQKLSEFIGQKKVKDNLAVFIQAAMQRGEALDHVLLSGPPGLGKTTLANILSKELNVDIKTTTGPILERAGDLAGLLTNLKEKDVLFIDEIHRVNSVVEEYLYSAMEDYSISILIDKGPSARSIQLDLPPFTLVGATTRAGLLTSPMRARFGVTLRMDFYEPEDLFLIIKRSAKILEIKIDDDAAMELAKRSRGTPRIANRLLRNTRDFAQVYSGNVITLDVVTMALKRLEVDEKGLDEMDRRILLTIIEKYNGGPVGLNTIAVAVGEEKDTIEEVYEPFLILQGFIKRTPRGRSVTHLAYEHFNMTIPNANRQQTLF